MLVASVGVGTFLVSFFIALWIVTCVVGRFLRSTLCVPCHPPILRAPAVLAHPIPPPPSLPVLGGFACVIVIAVLATLPTTPITTSAAQEVDTSAASYAPLLSPVRRRPCRLPSAPCSCAPRSRLPLPPSAALQVLSSAQRGADRPRRVRVRCAVRLVRMGHAAGAPRKAHRLTERALCETR
jgi:hypothetical protein